MTQHVAVRKDCVNRGLIQQKPAVVRESSLAPTSRLPPENPIYQSQQKKSPRSKKMRGDDLCFTIGASRAPRSPR